MRLAVIAKNIISGKCTVATKVTLAKSNPHRKRKLKLSMASV